MLAWFLLTNHPRNGTGAHVCWLSDLLSQLMSQRQVLLSNKRSCYTCERSASLHKHAVLCFLQRCWGDIGAMSACACPISHNSQDQPLVENVFFSPFCFHFLPSGSENNELSTAVLQHVPLKHSAQGHTWIFRFYTTKRHDRRITQRILFRWCPSDQPIRFFRANFHCFNWFFDWSLSSWLWCQNQHYIPLVFSLWCSMLCLCGVSGWILLFFPPLTVDVWHNLQ